MILQGLAGMPLVVDSCLVMPDRYELVVEQLCRKLEDVHAHASVWYRPPQGERVYYTMRVDATITCFISMGCLMMLLKSTCSYILFKIPRFIISFLTSTFPERHHSAEDWIRHPLVYNWLSPEKLLVIS